VPSIALLNWPTTNTYESTKVIAIRTLLNDFQGCQKIGTWWERTVGINIIFRSGTNAFCSMSDLLGIRPITGDYYSNWIIEVTTNYNGNTIPNGLVFPLKDNHPGNDARLKLYNGTPSVPFHFFLQMKIKLPPNEPLLNIITSMICYNLLEALMDTNIELKHTHMVLYIWKLSDDQHDLVENGKDTVLANVADVMIKVQKYAADNTISLPEKFEKKVIDYIDEFYDSNIHVLRDSKMREWMSPSLVALPMFFSEIENADKKT